MVEENPSKVVAFPFGKLSVDAVLALVKQSDYEDIVVIGRTKDGEYTASSSMDDLRMIHWALVKGERIIERCSET